MAREDVVVHEEEDLGNAMHKLVVPLNELDELDRLPNDSFYGFVDEVKEILEDSNLLLEDSREFDDLIHNKSIDDLGVFQNSSNLPTTIRSRFRVPKRSRNRIGRRKRRCFKSCSHCRTTKTPLWRECSKGPGTLCNACGMRYRTGRRLPEYRPASSPDFIQSRTFTRIFIERLWKSEGRGTHFHTASILRVFDIETRIIFI